MAARSLSKMIRQEAGCNGAKPRSGKGGDYKEESVSRKPSGGSHAKYQKVGRAVAEARWDRDYDIDEDYEDDDEGQRTGSRARGQRAWQTEIEARWGGE